MAELARLACWLGAIGFGGGLSVLATIREVLVVRRRWLTEREFATTATVSQMLPGGAAANALAYTGLRFHGGLGAVLAYTGFIAPGALAVTALAAAYVHFGVALRLAPALAGLNAAVVGLVASITLRMARTGIARAWQMGVAVTALLFALGGGAGPGEIAAFGIAAGLIMDYGTKRLRLSRWRRRVPPPSPPVALPEEGGALPPPRSTSLGESDRSPGPLPALLPPWLGAGVGGAGALATLAIVFVRAGLGAYGGGFAIVPNLQAVVLGHGWLTPQQFADAVAIGKLTPGPVLLMATFIGYLLHGPVGALVATLAIFTGPLVLVVSVGGWLARARSSRAIRAALRGLTPAVVGLMAAAALTLGQSLSGPVELAIAAATLLTLSRFSLNPVWLMAAGGLVRLALRVNGV